MRNKAKKPKYYVAQVGGNIQNVWGTNSTQPTPSVLATDSGNSTTDIYGNKYMANDPTQIGPAAPTDVWNPNAANISAGRTRKQFSIGNNPYVDAFNHVAQGITGFADNITNNQINKRENQEYLRANQRFIDNNGQPNTKAPAFTQFGGVTGTRYKVGGAAYSTNYQFGGEGYKTLVYDNDGDSDFPSDALEMLKAGGWIKGAVNPAHKGYCTPMTKATCTPHRKAFAMTMKKHHGFHKAQAGGTIPPAINEQNIQTPLPSAHRQQINQSASQAAAGNKPAPAVQNPQQVITIDKSKLQAQAKGNPYLTDSNKRYYWGELMNRDFPQSGGNVKQGVVNAANINHIDPNLLYASAMEEGMAGAIDSKHSSEAGTDYVNWTTKHPDMATKYPVDGFYNYGLDQFAGQSKDLEAKGYLPKGFSTSAFTTYKTKNEKNEELDAPAFTSDQNALIAKSAMIRQAGDQLDAYTKQKGITLSDKQKQFFTLANYNGGEGNMQKMLNSYQQKGYLSNDKFIDDVNFKPAAYGQIYGNVQARLQSAKLLQNNGYFAPTQQPQQGQQVSAQTQGQTQTSGMKNGGFVFKKQTGGSVNPYNYIAYTDPDDVNNKMVIDVTNQGGIMTGTGQKNKGMYNYKSVNGTNGVLTQDQYNAILNTIGTTGKVKDGVMYSKGITPGEVIPLIPKKQYGGMPVHDLETDNLEMFKAGGWIKGAINPAHKGYCTPMSKATCTPRRKALAMRFKHGDLHKGQVGGDLYNDVPQYEIDNNMLTAQAGGNIQQVQGLAPSQAGAANVEAEKGEVYTDMQGRMNQVDPNGATHEQGGEMLPQVHKVLENTSNLRNDKVSKYLKMSPEQIKALTGLDTNKSMSHAEALIEGANALEKQKGKLVANIALAAKNRQELDMYGENSTKLNIDHFRAMPTKEELFNRLFDHQEMTKNALGIGNDGEQAKMGGKYHMKAQTGVVAYPGNKSGQLTPAGNSDAFQGNLQDYMDQLKQAGVDISGVKSNADLQRVSYAYALKNNPDAIRNMWQQGIQNAGYDKAIKAGLAYDADDPKTGIKKGQFKPGVLDDSKNLQKLADLYPDNNLGVRILNLAKGSKNWSDSDLPQDTTTTPGKPAVTVSGNIRNTLNLKPQPKSDFDQPLNWYDTASATGTLLSAQRRLAERFNPAEIHQVDLKQLDPTVSLRSNQEDFNAAVNAVNMANPADIGTQMANIANLTSRKYALNNQVMGNYDNQNAQIKNNEISYNAQAKDRQSASDQAARENFSEKVFSSKAKQQEQKLTAMDSLYKTIAENAALNRNGNLIMKMSRAFDQYGNYNGYAPTFSPNPQLGIAANPSTAANAPTGKYQPAGGIQQIKPGSSYYNRRTGRTLRYDGTSLVEVK